MKTIEDVRLLGDQVLVRCLGTADMQSGIHIPASAQEARKIHQSGGDYLHRGEVLAVGPGDKTILTLCRRCGTASQRLDSAKNWNCTETVLGEDKPCGFPLDRKGELDRFLSKEESTDFSRAAINITVGDIVLYENRRDAALQPKRFPSLDLEDDTLVVLREEQHVLAVLEAA